MADSLKQLRALMTISLTVKEAVPGDQNAGIRPQPPEVQEVPMGAQFKARNAEEQQALIDMGAAEEVEKGEVVREADTVVIRATQEQNDPEQDKLNNLRRDYLELTGRDADPRMTRTKLQSEVDRLKAKAEQPTGSQPTA